MNIPIGELSRLSKVKIPTIRYYETIGLIPMAPRSDGNRRYYDSAVVERLRFIRHARDLGFDIDAIRDLLRLSDFPQLSCGAVDDIARQHLVHVERRLQQLESLRAELHHMIEACRHDRVANCRILSVLGDHAECLAAEHPPLGPRQVHLNHSGLQD